jgi:hypothetical protein
MTAIAFRKVATALLLFQSALLFGQEQFSFPMYFEDAVGNRDTVYFGYDGMATDSLDPAFGETDISQLSRDTVLDVRLAGNWQGQSHWQGQYLSPFQTKKQIASPLCNSHAPVFSVEIFTRHWPVTAAWDSTLFQGSCLSMTTFSSIISDGIADSRRVVNGVKGEFLGFVKLGEESRITFSEQRYGMFEYLYEFNSNTSRIDTVNLFWISLSRAAFDRFQVPVSKGGNKKQDLQFSPAGLLSFTLPTASRVTLEAFTMGGRRAAVLLSEDLPAGAHARRLNTTSLRSGLYFYRLRAGEWVETRKVMLPK